MADIISTRTQTAARRMALPRLRVPWHAVGATIIALPGALGRAFAMVYADPYASAHCRERGVPEEDLEGRDPNW